MWHRPSCEVHRNPRLCPLGPALCDAPSAVTKTAGRKARGGRWVLGRSTSPSALGLPGA